VSDVTAQLLALRASTADLIQGLLAEPWADADVATPSLCDGWTRGHVLTHLARNADGIADTIAGALRGEIVERYPGGDQARNAAIEAGAGRPFATLVADVRDSADRLDRVFAAVADTDGWALPTEHGNPACAWVSRRWREVEVHRIDLAADYTADRLPALLITELISSTAESLGKRADGPLRVTITEEGSRVPELAGRMWTVGEGDPVDVRGPDWAVLSWLIGRPAAANGALSATPPLREWR
jgi:maleylpyruvate isomerase